MFAMVLVPQLLVIAQSLFQPVNTEHFNKCHLLEMVHPFSLRGFEFPANPSTRSSSVCTFSGGLDG